MVTKEMLTAEVKITFKDAAKKLTGSKKRDFIAKVTEDYFGGSARKGETVMGWSRKSIELGIHERRTGIICVDNYGARGRHKSEEKLPNLEADIRSIVDEESQADPKMKSTYCYTQITARGVREALMQEKGYKELVTRETIGRVLNRLGYRLKKFKRQSL